MVSITDIEDPRIKPYRSLRTKSRFHMDTNIFVAEEKKVVLKLLSSNLDVLSCFAVPEFYDENIEAIKNKSIPKENLFYADKNVMNKIVGFRLHSGVMAIGKIPEQTSIEYLKPPIVFMNGIINSENVGAIIRNAAAFNIQSIIFDNETSSPYLRRAVRVSMGAIFGMDYYQSKSLEKDLTILRNQYNYTITAIELANNAIPIQNYTFPLKSVIIFGSEGKGINKNILEICDNIVCIPISDKVDSLNVAASSAIVFYHINQNII